MLSTRGGQGSPQVAAALADLVEDGATKIVLDVLSPDAVEQVVTDLLAAVPDADLLRVAERTRGNPVSAGRAGPRAAEEHIVVIESGRARLTDDRMPTRTRVNMRKRLGFGCRRHAERVRSLRRRCAVLVADLAR